LPDIPFGTRNLQHIEKIKSSSGNKNLVQIKYRDKKGNVSTRNVEPYKINGEDFWGYDVDKGGIRRFKIRNLRSVKSTQLSYEPRWVVEMNKVAMYEDAIYKFAALNKDVHLYPHQEQSVNRPDGSVIYAHGVGSGKTLTGIARFERMKSQGKASKALVVVPAGLRDNFSTQGVKKFTDSKVNVIGNKAEISSGQYHNIDPTADYNVISYEIFRSNPEKYIRESGADTVITDESHRGKNEYTATANALKETRGLYKNYIGLTGSVVSNEIADVLPLVDVASGGKHNLGKNKETFTKKYLRRSTDEKYKGLPEKRIPVAGFNNKKALGDELSKYVDYLDVDDVRDVAKIPKEDLNLVKVPVSKTQARIYRDLLHDDKKVRAMVTAKRLEIFKDEEVAKAYNKMIEARKLMNSVGSVHPGISLKESSRLTPKTKKLLDDLQSHLNDTPDGQALVFSNLINGGTDVLEAGLKDRHIDYGRFIGKGNKGITEEGRQQDISDYNKRKKKVMVISGAGGEGISLNDTTWEGVLDPHFNPEKMKQMEARGIRAHGLSHRNPEDRVVKVNRYMATMPKTFGLFKSRYRTPDEFIYEVAQHKDKQNKLLFDLLKKNRRDNQMNKTSSFYETEIYKKAAEGAEVDEKNTMEQEKPNIVFDFDGVIHSYKSGWKGNNVIPDEPVRGIKEAIEDLRKDHKVVVVSTRCAQPGGIKAIKKYLKDNDIEVDDVTDKKPPAIAYIDDNGINFDGDASSLPSKVRGFKSWLKKASEYEMELYKQAAGEQVMFHASPVQDIKRFRHSEDTSGNNKGKVVFVSPYPSFSAAFGLKWNDSNARLCVETKNKKVPDKDNYTGTTLRYTDNINLDRACSMYKLRGNFKPLRYEKDIEYYTNDDVEIISEEKFKSFKEMAEHYGLKLNKVGDAYIQNRIKWKKTSNFEKKASVKEEDQVDKDGKIPSIESALSDPVARKVATMIATSHEYKTPNVDGALALVKNYRWEEGKEKLKNLQGINKPVIPEKVLSIATGIKKDKGKVDPFIIVNQLHGIRPQTPGKKILFDGHHRAEACELLKMEEVPTYKGTYTGEAQKSKKELREKVAFYEQIIVG
jgi:hypothetical protein